MKTNKKTIIINISILMSPFVLFYFCHNINFSFIHKKPDTITSIKINNEIITNSQTGGFTSIQVNQNCSPYLR